MNGVISMSGDWHGVNAIAYIHHKYVINGRNEKLDVKSMTLDGYDCAVTLSHIHNLNLKTAASPAYMEKSFVLVSIDSPWKVFDAEKVSCNVDLEVDINLSAFGWLVYGARLCWYKLTGK